MSEPTSEIKFTPREMQMLALAWQCFDSDPKVDYAKLAALGGWTKGSAAVMMGALKRKLKKVAGDPSTPSATTPKKTPSGSGRGKKRAASGKDDDSPTKKRSKAKGTQAAAHLAEKDKISKSRDEFPVSADEFPDSKDELAHSNDEYPTSKAEFQDLKIKQEDGIHVGVDFEDFLLHRENPFTNDDGGEMRNDMGNDAEGSAAGRFNAFY